jgi:glutamate--cysteine ligase
VLHLAHLGLNARNRLNAAGDNETGFLEPLVEIVLTGITPAERKLRLYENGWHGSVDPDFTECAY